MSVRKRSWKSPTGEIKSAWQIDYIDAGGIRRRETVATKKEADARHAETTVGVRNGTHTADSASVTVAVAAQQWLDACDVAKFERATVVAYSQHVRLHIVPRLGNVRLSQLTAPMIAAFERSLREDGTSEVMIRKARTSLGAILTEAQRNGLVNQNVVRALGRAKVSKRADDEGRAEVGIDIPTPAEIRTLLPHLQGRLRTLILTAIFTGLRWSELRGLTWANVDLKAGELHVRQRADRYGVIGQPKSAAGKRSVPLLALVVNALREHAVLSGQGANRTDDLVFVNTQGAMEHRNTVIQAYQAAQVAAFGVVKYKGLHALRHFFASWCINRKADGGRELPLKVVQGLLGHASIQMTADVYGHLFPRADDTVELAAAERAFLAG